MISFSKPFRTYSFPCCLNFFELQLSVFNHVCHSSQFAAKIAHVASEHQVLSGLDSLIHAERPASNPSWLQYRGPTQRDPATLRRALSNWMSHDQVRYYRVHSSHLLRSPSIRFGGESLECILTRQWIEAPTFAAARNP